MNSDLALEARVAAARYILEQRKGSWKLVKIDRERNSLKSAAWARRQ